MGKVPKMKRNKKIPRRATFNATQFRQMLSKIWIKSSLCFSLVSYLINLCDFIWIFIISARLFTAQSDNNDSLSSTSDSNLIKLMVKQCVLSVCFVIILAKEYTCLIWYCNCSLVILKCSWSFILGCLRLKRNEQTMVSVLFKCVGWDSVIKLPSVNCFYHPGDLPVSVEPKFKENRLLCSKHMKLA